MSTSIRYVPPSEAGPPVRSVSAMERRPPYPPTQKVRGGSPGTSPQQQFNDIDQQMRMFMAEKARDLNPKLPPASTMNLRNRHGKNQPFSPAASGSSGGPAIATTATYHSGGRIITRTELWRTGGSATVGQIGGSPTAGPGRSTPSPSEPDTPASNLQPPKIPQRPTRNPLVTRPAVPLRSGGLSSDGSWGAPSQDSGQMQGTQQIGREMSGQQQYLRASNRQRKMSTDARSLRSMSHMSISPPPTPPEKDEHWVENRSPKPPSRYRMDSVILPPPPSSLLPQRSNSLRRQNNPNLRINVPQEPPGTKPIPEMKPSKSKKKKSPTSRKQPSVLQCVLGIYPAENALPPGRSAADEFTSMLVTRFTKNKSHSQDSLPLSSKSAPTPVSSKDSTPITRTTPPPSSKPWLTGVSKFVYSQTDGMIIAELPGSVPGPAEGISAELEIETKRSPLSVSDPKGNFSSGEGRVTRNKTKGSKPRKESSKRRETPRKVELLPPQPANDGKYANMPLPAIPPTALSSLPVKSDRTDLKTNVPDETYRQPAEEGRQPTEEDAKRFRMAGQFLPDVSYNKEIAEWAESFYPRPEPSPPDGESGVSSESPKPLFNPSVRASVLNPEGAVRGVLFPSPGVRNNSNRASRRSTVRVSTARTMSMTPSEWSNRASCASSIGDAFQYDDEGLGTIGEGDGSSLHSVVEEEPDTPKVFPSKEDLEVVEKKDGFEFGKAAADIVIKVSNPASDDDADINDDLSPLAYTLGYTDAHSSYSDDDYSSFDDRSSVATTALLDAEINAILGVETNENISHDTSLSRRDTTASEYSYYTTTPSSPDLLDAEIDQLIAETAGYGTQEQRMTVLLQQGFRLSDLEVVDDHDEGMDFADVDDHRKTRYLAGRNSDMSADILFCLPSGELRSSFTGDGYR